jgi:hypothetical protein
MTTKLSERLHSAKDYAAGYQEFTYVNGAGERINVVAEVRKLEEELESFIKVTASRFNGRTVRELAEAHDAVVAERDAALREAHVREDALKAATESYRAASAERDAAEKALGILTEEHEQTLAKLAKVRDWASQRRYSTAPSTNRTEYSYFCEHILTILDGQNMSPSRSTKPDSVAGSSQLRGPKTTYAELDGDQTFPPPETAHTSTVSPPNGSDKSRQVTREVVLWKSFDGAMRINDAEIIEENGLISTCVARATVTFEVPIKKRPPTDAEIVARLRAELDEIKSSEDAIGERLDAILTTEEVEVEDE